MATHDRWLVSGVGTLLIAVALASCTHYVRRAESAYESGRYLEAAEDLAAHEQEVERLPPAHRAQYGVYRGLSLLELGELEDAQRWLRYSATVEELAPGSLAPYQRMQLDRGLARIKKRSATAPSESTPEPPPRKLLPAPTPSPR